MVHNLLSSAQFLFAVCISTLCLLACRPSSSPALSPAVQTSPGPGPTPTCYLLPQPTGEKYSPALIETSPPAQAAPDQAVTVRFSGGYGLISNNARICGEETVGYIYSDELPSFSTRRTVQLLFGGQQLATAECDRECEITTLIPPGTLPDTYRLELQIPRLLEETYFDIRIVDETKLLMTGLTEVGQLAWTPDGRALTAVAGDTLYWLPLDGGPAQPLFSRPDLRLAAWAP